MISASDVTADALSAGTSWSVDGGMITPGLPGGLFFSHGGCLITDGRNRCTWTISGNPAVPAGAHTILISATDDDGGQTDMSVLLNVSPEDASVRFDADNPIAVQVAEPEGDSGAFSLIVHVREALPDVSIAQPAAPGDINLAQISMDLMPVGPGSTVTGTCVPAGVAGPGYDAVLVVVCDFNAASVNTYGAEVSVDGGYYTGSGEDVLVVFDPSSGFTTGGGWFFWPGTDNPATGYPGDKTNFGYTMKYLRSLDKPKGSLLLIRHLADGTLFRVKSNAMYGLALGDQTEPDPFGWATFSGKCTYLEPGWLEPLGNYTFTAYVEDRGEPGNGFDRFWIEVWDRDNIVEPDLSMVDPAIINAETIQGGNIVVPHASASSDKRTRIP
jgi:hypothetical protein